MVYSEFDMRAACAEAKKIGRVRKAARKFHVPYTSLRNRLNGILPHAVAHQASQKLSPRQEDLLADWILFQGSLGDTPTHSTIKEIVRRIAVDRGDTTAVGKRWVGAFLKRYPVLKTQRPRRIETTRIKAATAKVIRP